MTKKEIIYSVIEKLGIYTDDADFSEELISSLVDSKRAMLLKQQYSRNPWHMPTEIKQELCLDLEVTDNIEGVSCFGKILRTKLALPASIKIKGKEGPLLIRKADRTQIAVNIVPVERFPYIGYNSFTRGLLYGAIDLDGRLYFLSGSKKHLFLESVKVTDVYEQPDLAYELECNSTADTIEAIDAEYPIEAAMVDPVVDLVVKELTKSMGIPQDNVNDAEDIERN